MKSHWCRFPSMYIAVLWTILASYRAVSSAPGKVSSTTVTVTGPTAFNVQFQTVESATKYHITISPKHGTESSWIVETCCTSKDIIDLTVGTLYDVIVKAFDADGDAGEDSDTTTVQTFLSPPTLRTSQSLPNSVIVFFESKIAMSVSKWKIEHRKESAPVEVTTVDSISGQYGAFWLSALQPDTAYEVRAGAAELRGTTSIADVQYSPWVKFSTDQLSVFGRVVLSDVTYAASYSIANSAEWNQSLADLTAAYSDRTEAFVSISVVHIESSEGKPLVHYQLKVKDSSLPSSTDFTLTSSKFSSSELNNGRSATGTAYALVDGNDYGLVYIPTSSCMKLVERFMLVSVEGSEEHDIHLNVADSSATTADEQDDLKVDGTALKRDDGKASVTVQPNKILGLVPKFLLKDCLDSGSSTPFYSLIHGGLNSESLSEMNNYFFHTTEATSSVLNEDSVTATYYANDNSVILSIPSVDKAITYELRHLGQAIFTISEQEIDESNVLKMKLTVSSLSEGQYWLSVTTRKSDGMTTSFDSTTVTVTSGSTCSGCTTSIAYCGESASGKVYCPLEGTAPSTPCIDLETKIDNSSVKITYFTANYSLAADMAPVSNATKFELTDSTGSVIYLEERNDADNRGKAFFIPDIRTFQSGNYTLKVTIATCGGTHSTIDLDVTVKSGEECSVCRSHPCCSDKFCGLGTDGSVYCPVIDDSDNGSGTQGTPQNGAGKTGIIRALPLVVSFLLICIFM